MEEVRTETGSIVLDSTHPPKDDKAAQKQATGVSYEASVYKQADLLGFAESTRVWMTESVCIEIFKANAVVDLVREPSPVIIRVYAEMVFGDGNFRGILLHALKQLMARDNPSLGRHIVFEAVGRYYQKNRFNGFRSFQSTSHVPLDLSSSGLPEETLADLVQNIRYKLPSEVKRRSAAKKEGVKSNSPGLRYGESKHVRPLDLMPRSDHSLFMMFSHLSQLDLSNNNLSYTRRALRLVSPSVCQRLASWLDDPHCSLQSLNLSGNRNLGGSTEFYEGKIGSRLGWGSDIYLIVTALHNRKSNNFKSLIISNTGVNEVDFRYLGLMLQAKALLFVDVSKNPAITLNCKADYEKIFCKRYESKMPALILDVSETALLSPLQDPILQDPVLAFESEIYYQLERLILQSLGNGMFERYKEKQYPTKWDTVVKLMKVISFVVVGVVGTLIPIVPLVFGLIETCVSASAKTAGLNIVELLGDIFGLFDSLGSEDKKLLEELFSTENVEVALDVIKNGKKLVVGFRQKYKAYGKVSDKYKASARDRKIVEELSDKAEAVVKLFQGDEQIRRNIVSELSYQYHEIIRGFSGRDAKYFARGLGAYFRVFLLETAVKKIENKSDLAKKFMVWFQTKRMNIYDTVKIKAPDLRGYARVRDRNFSDLFAVSRGDSIQLLKKNSKRPEFKSIVVSMSSLLLNESNTNPDRCFYINRNGVRINLVQYLEELEHFDADQRFSLSDLLSADESEFFLLGGFGDVSPLSLLSQLFFMMHTSDNDLCYGHPALLQAVAMLQKVSLYLWERTSDGRLIPYSEASYARYIHPKSTQRIDLLVENGLYFTQIRFSGYDNKPPLENNFPVFSLSQQQLADNVPKSIWTAHFHQRTGLMCMNARNQILRFNINKKISGGDSEEWMHTEQETYGCLQASSEMLGIIKSMVNDYVNVSQGDGSSVKQCQLIQCGDRQYLRRPVLLEDDASFQVFHLKRDEAYQLLLTHMESIRHILKDIVVEMLLLNERFVDYVKHTHFGRHSLADDFTDEYAALQEDSFCYAVAVSGDPKKLEGYANKLKRHAEDQRIILKYLDYDVKERKVDEGWCHPGILYALAQIHSVNLVHYEINSEGVMVPHRKFPGYRPQRVNRSMQLLFTQGNHFEIVELNAELDDDKTTLIKRDPDNAIISGCGKFKLNKETLEKLAAAGELRLVTPIPDVSTRVDVLEGRIGRSEVMLLNHENRIKSLESRSSVGVEVNAEVVDRVTFLLVVKELGETKDQVNELKDQLVSVSQEAKNAMTKAEEALEYAKRSASQVDQLQARIQPLGHPAQPGNRNNDDQIDQRPADAPMNPALHEEAGIDNHGSASDTDSAEETLTRKM